MAKKENMKTNSDRMRYFDSLRLIAMFIIFAVHFINKFHNDYFYLWKEFPTSLLLKGVTGKLGVALFGVILGYFAYLSKESNTTRYVIKRYAFFAISGFVINILLVLAGWLLPGFKERSIITAVTETFILGDGVFATYWCIQAFFAASVISYINGKANVSNIVILCEIGIFILLQEYWISVCLMGNIVAKNQNNKYLDFCNNRIVRIILWCVLFFAIKRPESSVTYIIQGICCSIMIILIMRGSIVKKMLNGRLLSSIGKRGMGVFLLHPLLYNIFGPILFDCFAAIPYPYAFCIAMMMCFAITVLVSFPLMWVINRSTTFVGDVITKK